MIPLAIQSDLCLLIGGYLLFVVFVCLFFTVAAKDLPEDEEPDGWVPSEFLEWDFEEAA